MESFLVLGNRVIISSVDRRILEFYKASPTDLDGVIDQLRVTKGVEVAIFIYELATQEYKVSLRSNGDVDVSKIAIYFGGGGHIKAAGCTMRGSLHDVINNLIPHVETQLNTIYGNSLIVDIKGS
jgi:phosphoesterase RecJ-like protein